MHPDPMPKLVEPGLRENREGQRKRSLFAIGKLVHAGRQQICRVRNISDGGVGIRLALPPEPGARVTISMRGLPPTAAEIRWVEGEDAGLAFDAPISTLHIGDDTGLTPRSPRFALDRLVRVSVQGEQVEGVAIDISLGGLKLIAPAVIEVGTAVTVHIDGDADALRGRTCWSSGASAGVHFGAPLPISRLAAILSLATG